MKDLKYEHQSIFPLWGRLKLNFRDRYRKPHIYSVMTDNIMSDSQPGENIN